MRNSAQWQVRPGIPAIAAVYAVLQQAAIQRQPLVPLPLLDNKGKLAELVHVSGVYSTDLERPDDALCAKYARAADNWQPVADDIWGCTKGKRGIRLYQQY